MSNDDQLSQERARLLEEQGQINDELTHLREFLQAEVDVEPDEGDSEVFEAREKCRSDRCIGTALRRHRDCTQVDGQGGLRHLPALRQADRA